MIAGRRRTFGAKLREFRERRGLSLRDLGLKSGVSFRCLGLVESGQRGLGPDHASRIAAALELDGWEQAQFLKRASQTLTPRGQSRASSGCPPFLAQLFGKHLSLLLKIDLSDIELVGCISHPALFSTTSERTLNYACEQGGKPAPLKPDALRHIALHKSWPLLFVVFLRDGSQAIVQCGARTF